MEISNFQMIHIQGNWKSQLLGNITRYIHNSAVASITSVESEILVSSIKVVQAKHYPTLPVSMHPILKHYTCNSVGTENKYTRSAPQCQTLSPKMPDWNLTVAVGGSDFNVA